MSIFLGPHLIVLSLGTFELLKASKRIVHGYVRYDANDLVNEVCLIVITHGSERYKLLT